MSERNDGGPAFPCGSVNIGDGLVERCQVYPTADPALVVWPDGVAEIHLDTGVAVLIYNNRVGIQMPGHEADFEQDARQLAALLIAAANKIGSRE